MGGKKASDYLNTHELSLAWQETCSLLFLKYFAAYPFGVMCRYNICIMLLPCMRLRALKEEDDV